MAQSQDSSITQRQKEIKRYGSVKDDVVVTPFCHFKMHTFKIYNVRVIELCNLGIYLVTGNWIKNSDCHW